jgi:poly-gamma-glutamate synthesis protein (capsule biosynthesis protein)
MKDLIRLFAVLLLVSTSASANPTGKNLVLGFTGDILPAYQLDPYQENYGWTYPFTLIYKRLQSYDILCGNLECPIAGYGTAVKNKRFYFKASPSACAALKWAGFDLLNLANNHTLDFGDSAFLQTMENLQANGLSYVGGGADLAEATRMKVIQSHDLKVGYLAYNMIPPDYYAATGTTAGVAFLNKDLLRKAILENMVKVDILVVIMHWGIEYQYAPTPEQIELGRYAIDWGADLVVGHHPHVVQPMEIYKGKPIVYSLGNFVFGTYGDPPNNTADYGLLLEVTVSPSKELTASLIPLNVFNHDTKFMTRELEPERIKDFFAFYNRLCLPFNTVLDLEGNRGTARPLK